MNTSSRYDFVIVDGVTVSILESSFDLALDRFKVIFGESLFKDVKCIVINY